VLAAAVELASAVEDVSAVEPPLEPVVTDVVVELPPDPAVVGPSEPKRS
jgi:hypothetical protein